MRFRRDHREHTGDFEPVTADGALAQVPADFYDASSVVDANTPGVDVPSDAENVDTADSVDTADNVDTDEDDAIEAGTAEGGPDDAAQRRTLADSARSVAAMVHRPDIVGLREQVAARPRPLRTAGASVSKFFSSPFASFHMITALAVVLTGLGLMMVLSASSVESYGDTGSSYGLVRTQLIFVVFGAIGFVAALHMSPGLLRRLSGLAMVIAFIMLVLVLIPGIGTRVNGGQRWFTIAGMSFQPSEFAKVALIMWGAHILAMHRREDDYKTMMIPLVPVALVMCALILAEKNQSTTMIMALITGTLLFFAGISWRLIGVMFGVAVTAAMVLILIEPFRLVRFRTFLDTFGGRLSDSDSLGSHFQSEQALISIANGGLLGTGAGNGATKFNNLPNAENDFIFAIVAEELGGIGAIVVLGLFLAVALVGFRIARRNQDPFLRLVVSTSALLMAAQGVINSAYVVGLLPVTGIQLPLISAGGTSALFMLTLFGIMANAARHESEAVAAAATQPDGRISRLLRLPKPRPYLEPAPAVRKARSAPRGRQPGPKRPPRMDPARRRGDIPARGVARRAQVRGNYGRRPVPESAYVERSFGAREARAGYRAAEPARRYPDRERESRGPRTDARRGDTHRGDARRGVEPVLPRQPEPRQPAPRQPSPGTAGYRSRSTDPGSARSRGTGRRGGGPRTSTARTPNGRNR